MGIFDALLGKKKKAETSNTDDMSYIAQLHHIQGPWQQYDFLLAAGGYGWNYIIDSADYMTKAELEQIGTVSLSKVLGGPETELIKEYHSAGNSVKAMGSLAEEGGALGIGGMSKIVGGPVKVIWINQSRVLRLFTPVNDEDLMTRYAETIIRRTFGTPDAMKEYKRG